MPATIVPSSNTTVARPVGVHVVRADFVSEMKLVDAAASLDADDCAESVAQLAIQRRRVELRRIPAAMQRRPEGPPVPIDDSSDITGAGGSCERAPIVRFNRLTHRAQELDVRCEIFEALRWPTIGTRAALQQGCRFVQPARGQGALDRRRLQRGVEPRADRPAPPSAKYDRKPGAYGGGVSHDGAGIDQRSGIARPSGKSLHAACERVASAGEQRNIHRIGDATRRSGECRVD
jgi:hypothetical protein